MSIIEQFIIARIRQIWNDPRATYAPPVWRACTEIIVRYI